MYYSRENELALPERANRTGVAMKHAWTVLCTFVCLHCLYCFPVIAAEDAKPRLFYLSGKGVSPGLYPVLREYPDRLVYTNGGKEFAISKGTLEACISEEKLKIDARERRDRLDVKNA